MSVQASTKSLQVLVASGSKGSYSASNAARHLGWMDDVLIVSHVGLSMMGSARICFQYVGKGLLSLARAEYSSK